MKISNRQYQNTHGKAPRGFGAWAFEITDESSDTTLEVIFIKPATFADAKREAIEYVKANYAEAIKTGFVGIHTAP